MSENKPKRKDGSEDFLTRLKIINLKFLKAFILKFFYSRCILKLRPLSGSISEPNLTFSVIHPLIVDNRVEEQTKAFSSGRDDVLQRVENLKIQTA